MVDCEVGLIEVMFYLIALIVLYNTKLEYVLTHYVLFYIPHTRAEAHGVFWGFNSFAQIFKPNKILEIPIINAFP